MQIKRKQKIQLTQGKAGEIQKGERKGRMLADISRCKACAEQSQCESEDLKPTAAATERHVLLVLSVSVYLPADLEFLTYKSCFHMLKSWLWVPATGGEAPRGLIRNYTGFQPV